MAKRFTATEKWNDGWFLELHKDYKLMWGYILDTCTNGGRWVKNFKLLNFCCESNITEQEFLDIFNGKVTDIDDYGDLNRFGQNNKGKAVNLIKQIKQARKKLGEERFMYCLGDKGFESILQIIKIGDLANLVNVLLCEVRAKESE